MCGICKAKRGERKGENISNGYQKSLLHKWIRKHKPKSEICQLCGEKKEKLHLSNISGEYKRDINDFWWLCFPCHMRFDRVHRTHKKKKHGVFSDLFFHKKDKPI
jgi:hypothetical protein